MSGFQGDWLALHVADMQGRCSPRGDVHGCAGARNLELYPLSTTAALLLLEGLVCV